jgi:hypothetical protein
VGEDGNERCAVLAKPRSKASPRGATRRRSSRPRTEPMAWPLTPSVAALARTGSSLSAGPVSRSRQARLHDHLVKGDRFVETRTPSLDECSLPRPLTPCGARERDRREPATVPTVLPPRTGFRRPFTLRARGRGLDPDAVSDWTRRLSSTSATRTAREHNRVDPPDPWTGSRRRSSPSSRWTGRRTSRTGLLPRPPRRPPSPGGAHGFVPPATLADRRGGPPPGTGRGLTGQGPAERVARRLAPRTPPSRGWYASGPARTRDPVTELRPNPIRSDTSRRGTAGAPAGEPGAARRCPAPGERWARRHPTIPPHEPCSPREREERRARVPLRGSLSRNRQTERDARPPLARSAHARPARMRVGPLAQSRRPPGAEGRFTRFSAKRTRIRRHPRCLPSTSCPVRAASGLRR